MRQRLPSPLRDKVALAPVKDVPLSKNNLSYDYDQETKRMDRVTGPRLPSYGAAYEDATDSRLVTK